MNGKNRLQRLALAAGFLAVSSVGAFAQTDISQVVSTVSSYWDAAIVVGIGVLLFVIGRRVVKKGI